MQDSTPECLAPKPHSQKQESADPSSEILRQSCHSPLSGSSAPQNHEEMCGSNERDKGQLSSGSKTAFDGISVSRSPPMKSTGKTTVGALQHPGRNHCKMDPSLAGKPLGQDNLSRKESLSLVKLLDQIPYHGILSDGEFLEGLSRVCDSCPSPQSSIPRPSLCVKANVYSPESEESPDDESQSSGHPSTGVWQSVAVDDTCDAMQLCNDNVFCTATTTIPNAGSDDVAENLPDLVFKQAKEFQNTSGVPNSKNDIGKSQRGTLRNSNKGVHFQQSTTGINPAVPGPSCSPERDSPLSRSFALSACPDSVLAIDTDCACCSKALTEQRSSLASFDPPTPYQEPVEDMSNRDIHIRIAQVHDELRILNLALARRKRSGFDDGDAECESPQAVGDKVRSDFCLPSRQFEPEDQDKGNEVSRSIREAAAEASEQVDSQIDSPAFVDTSEEADQMS